MSKKNVVVIGAGLGGISAAVSLASRGYHVDLFEKNDHLGGKLNVMDTEGFTFDLGPSILTLPSVFESLFERADEDLHDHLDLIELDLQWRSFFEDDTVIDLYHNLNQTQQQNEYIESQHIDQLQSFLSYAEGIYQTAEHGYFAEGLDTIWDFVRHYGPLAFYNFDYFSTVNEGVQKHIDDPKLRDILNFFIKYVGSSPYDAPAMLNLLPYVQQEFGLWYVNGGMYQLASALETLLKQVDVQLHLNTEITNILIENQQATGVLLDDGTRHQADMVVSNMEVIPTYEHLLDQTIPELEQYRSTYKPSCSGLVMHLGLDCTYEQLAHHNFFFSRDPRSHFDEIFHQQILPKDPTIYLVAPGKTDHSVAPEGCENLKILPHIPHMDESGDFSEEEYAKFRTRLLDKLERMGLDSLRDHIVVEETLYPHDIQKMYYAHRGAIYGVVSDQENRALKAPKRSEFFDDLFFTGGSVNPGAGMPMVTLCGQLVADQIAEYQSSSNDWFLS